MKEQALWLLVFVIITASTVAPCFAQSQVSTPANSASFSGLPFLQSFTNEDYDGEQINREIIQSKNGSLLIANAGGLLQYDGERWRTFGTDDIFSLTALTKSNFPGRIWAGAYADLGYFQENEAGYYQFHSLLDLIPTHNRNISDIYTIVEHGSQVWFASDRYLFKYQENDSSMQVIEELEYRSEKIAKSAPVTFIYNFNAELYAFLSDGAIVKQEGKEWTKQNEHTVQPGQVTSVGSLGDSLFISDNQLGVLTYKDGLVTQISSPANSYLRDHEITDLAVFKSGELAVSTGLGGTFILHPSGEVKLWLGINSGLVENNHQNLFIDTENDLWIAGEQSITVVHTGLPVTQYPANLFNIGDVLHVEVFEDELYLASMQGLYRLNGNKSTLYDEEPENLFYKYEGFNSAFWNFLTVDDELWVGGKNGVYAIEGDGARKIASVETRQMRKHPIQEDIVLLITYNGVQWLQKSGDRWLTRGQIEGLNSLIYELTITDSGTIWAGTIQGFMYRADFNSEKNAFNIRRYTPDDGLPESTIYEPVSLEESLYVNTRNGFTKYNSESDRFEPATPLNTALDNQWGEYMRQTSDGSLYIMYRDAEFHRGVAQLKPDLNNNWNRIYTPFEISNVHFENFLEIDGQNFWSGSAQAVMHLDLNSAEQASSQLQASISGVRSSQNQEQLSWNNSELTEIPYDESSIRIEFASGSFRAPSRSQYRYRLGTGTWSQWQTEPWHDETNLWPGKHTFEVQARDFRRNVSEPATLAFTILPPWYLTTWAFLFYIVLFGGIVVAGSSLISSYRLRKRMQQLTLEEAANLKDLDEFKTRLLINISHELRTPLTLVLGSVEQLYENASQLGDDWKRRLYLARRNGKRLHQLVEQVLDLTRLDAKQIDLNPSVIKLNSFLKRTLESFESMAGQHEVKLNANLPDKKTELYADVDKFEKVLVNLLSNAIKFTPAKGTVELSMKDQDSFIQIMVSDTGRGIPKDQLAYIFDRFHSTRERISGGGKGLGVGLSITKEFVDLHGGSITVESEINKGTTFTIFFPKKEYDSQLVPVRKEPESDPFVELEVVPPSPLSEIRKKASASTVLVVEDNDDMRRYITELLEAQGLIVKTANNGLEGKKELSMAKPDLIISDIMMPEMDGFEFAAHVRSVPEYLSTPIVLLSARAEVEDRIQGYEIGVSDYLVKPFNAQELKVRVQNLLLLKTERDKLLAETNHETEEPSEATAFVQDLQQFVEEHIQQPDITVEQLSNNANVSRRQLYRKLKASTGFTPAEFVREIKLYKARDILEAKQKQTISEVAYAVGFSTPSYFSKIFKSRFGRSPGEYL